MTQAMMASLSEEGWITDSKRMVDSILANYILTDVAQSYVFQGKLLSLPRVYYAYINEPEKMADAVRKDLEALLGSYFDNIEVKSSVKQSGTTKYYYILVSAVCTDSNGVLIDITKIAELTTSRARTVYNVGNYGEGMKYIAGIL
jgi:hypothetical protein